MRVFSQINNCQQKQNKTKNKKTQTKQKGGLRFKAWLNLYIKLIHNSTSYDCDVFLNKESIFLSVITLTDTLYKETMCKSENIKIL